MSCPDSPPVPSFTTLVPEIFRKLLLALIAVYQVTFSYLFGPRCRFWPSCSEYARLSLLKDPITTAFTKILKRLLKCHPLHPGGVDLP